MIVLRADPRYRVATLLTYIKTNIIIAPKNYLGKMRKKGGNAYTGETHTHTHTVILVNNY